ncbi:MAG: EamA family transporter [Candidatus Hodarchaeales archaeon]|jgi:drug/metabolite transporter (DMT)-like permease
MAISLDNIIVLAIMILYGLVSGSSVILLKIGIFRAGGTNIQNFFRDFGPTLWRFMKTPIWMTGGVAAITGFLIYTVALNIYDVSVVKPLVNTNLLFTFLFAYFVFKEKLSRIEWFGIAILVFGLIFSALSPNVESTERMNIPLLLVFLPITLVMMLIMVSVMFVSKKERHAEFIFPIFSGSFFGMGTFFTKSLLISMKHLTTGDLLMIFMFIYSTFMLLLTYAFAITAQQFAFEQGRLSIVSPIANSLSVSLSFIGAYFVFYEDLIVPIEGIMTLQSFSKIIGLICILIALLILRREISPVYEKLFKETKEETI